ncbi:uncharacterized protein [Littorina saxatilis]|uniref:Fibrinogen C-terminal domain-containing protein n=1 Tax=Littorina saxatilis TaxID=31220 RepID=A0AAN9BF08_9CAEN
MMWCGISFFAVLLVTIPPGLHAGHNQVQEVLDKVTAIQGNLTTDLGLIKERTENIPQRLSAIDKKLVDLQKTCTSRQTCTDRLLKLDNGYYLAFRITPGIQSSAYQKFVAVGKSDDPDCLVVQNVPEGCKTTDGRRFCDRHYRSRLIDLWDQLPILRVRVGVYKDNVEQRFFEFNGKNSNYDNWFSQSRLIKSSYTDLSAATRPQPNFFSIAGDHRHGRHFFINNNYGGCNADAGWLVVSDRPAPYPTCFWQSVASKSYPLIFFSSADAKSNFNNRTTVGFADTLVISIKLDNTQ